MMCVLLVLDANVSAGASLSQESWLWIASAITYLRRMNSQLSQKHHHHHHHDDEEDDTDDGNNSDDVVDGHPLTSQQHISESNVLMSCFRVVLLPKRAWVENFLWIWDDASLYGIVLHFIALLFIWWHRIVLKCIARYFPSWRENSQIFEMMYHRVKHVLRKSPKYWGWYITGSISTYATKFHSMCVISTWAVLHCIKRHTRDITGDVSQS